MDDKNHSPEATTDVAAHDPLEATRDRQNGLALDFPAGTPRRRREVPAARIMRLAESFRTEVGVPVRINNAVITGDLTLPGAVFAHGLVITKTIFRGAVDLSRADFKGGLDLSRSLFTGPADFRGAHVGGDCVMKRARFWQSCRFDDAHFGGSFAARGARFRKDASFRQARFDSSASFRCHVFRGRRRAGPAAPAPKVFPTVFGGKLDFARSAVEGLLSFEGAQFKGKVDFQRAQLRNTTAFSSYPGGDNRPLLSRTRFHEDADFTACEIGAGAAFLGVEFRKAANFERLCVGGHLLFKPLVAADVLFNTSFGGEAKFLGARVNNNAEFDGAYFLGEAIFDHFEVERNVYFRPAARGGRVWFYTEFFGRADFVGARVKGDAEFTGSWFWKKVRLDSIHVEGNAFFDNEYSPFRPPARKVPPVMFMKDVNLVSAHFMHQAKFTGAVFLGEVRCRSADFEGAALFEGAWFGDRADFTGSTFGQHADFHGSTFEGAADFKSVRVDGAAFFEGAAFLGRTSFLAASFKSLGFGLRKPPAGARAFGGELDLSGFTYELIDINENLLGDIFGSMREYNRQAFTQLEKVLRSIGQDDWADITYLYRREREHEERAKRVAEDFRGGAFRRWTRGVAGMSFDLAQDAVVNYGIRPFARLLAISLAVLFAGSLMFWQEGAVVPRDADARTSYVIRPGENGEAGALPADEKAARVVRLDEGGRRVVAAAEGAAEPVQLGFTQAVGVSFNQFIPIIQIPSGSKWKPSEKLIPLPGGRRFYYFSYAFYGTIHGLLGAVLMPLGVAALTGILHRRERPGK